MNIEFEFDQRQGRPVPTRDGHYFRFTLILKEDDGSHLLEMRGFRVNVSLSHIYPPMNKNGYSSFPVVDLAPDFAKRLLEKTTTYLKGQGVSAA